MLQTHHIMCTSIPTQMVVLYPCISPSHTRSTPSLSPPPPPKRGRSGRQGRGRDGRTAHQCDHSPSSPGAAQNQPDSPQSPDQPAPRAPSMQPTVVLQPADRQAAAIQAIADQLAKMQQDAREFQAAAARDREAGRQEMLRRTASARPPAPVATTHLNRAPAARIHLRPTRSSPTHQLTLVFQPDGPPPYPTQGYSTPALTQASCSQGHPAPPQAQPTRPPGTTDLLPDGEETFTDFCPPQFAVPTNSAGEEQLKRAGLDPQLQQQMADPASALREDAHSSKQANLILRGVSLADPSTTGGLNQKPSDNPPLTAKWPHKKVWLAKTGHWAEYDGLSVEQFVQGYLEIVLPTIPVGPSTEFARDHIGYLQNMMRDTSSCPWHLARSTHKQILLMVKHKQLKWEDTATRNSIRAAQLLLAKEEAIQAKFLVFPTRPR